MSSPKSKSEASPENAGPSSVRETADSNAVDESDDVDSDFVTLQKTLSKKRRAAKDSPESRRQKAFPFPFAPNTRPLTISDCNSCVALETAAFPHPEHRASPEKFEYRLTICPELSLGVFCTIIPDQLRGWNIETLASAKPVETDRANGSLSVLLAHIVSTRCCGEVVTDSDMDYPRDWRTRGGRSAEVGHQEAGQTIALHSLAVSPKLQGCGVGKMIVKAYLQQMNDSGLADRVSLICQDHLISYYERFGFKHRGESKAKFGGGCWHD
ncbi:polyamine acetyltransferase [Diplogelasinospora grovesii]|uniref:Polyamine acetyltransferase n=1 Tax=Diplogelasinospora grovesii TaxID=303347 RepID=A0AAN6S4Z3_9PEZI|nr:polyamine acetyltransferase [Diplogelasinospora grovesii]